MDLPALRNEVIVDRATQPSVRNRFDALRMESGDLEVQTRQLTDALETLVRIQARYKVHFHRMGVD